ncbi:MAG: RPA family protein [Methanothrix sp.]
MAGFSREVAKRIFAEELKSSNYSFRDGEDQHQYAPSYLLTPTGAKCNRVFVVGTLTEKDDIGGDTEYWRGRVVDPTGSILIYAGQYQPEAAQILANMEAPSFVAVVGKPNLYQTDDGNIIISLRAESIQRVDENTRNQWIIDTASRTLERLEALKNARPIPVSSDFATADNVPASSSSSTPAQDTDRALQHYHTDIEHFRQMVLRALSSLKTELAKSDMPPETKTAKSAIAESEKKPATAPAEPEEVPASRKSKPKKSEPNNTWPAPEDEEEVETINFGKKS